MTTSTAEMSLKEGRLDETLALLQDQVRKNPDVAKHRVFLFQLLALNGQWDRALNQLNVCGNLDPSNLAMVQTYREAIRCEMLREKIFLGETSPLVFGEPEQWIALLIEAGKLSAEARYEQAGELRDQAFELAPAISGSFNGSEFDWIADSDTRIGPVVEAIVNGRYYWIPFSRIARIQIEAPSDLRDLVWLPAQFTWVNGGTAFGLIPSRYPGSDKAEDAMLRLARKTEWIELPAGHYHGLGQRILVTDQGEHALFDARELIFNSDVSVDHG
ncbi:Protein of avirulence locus ImpE [Methylomonas albis]|uniref:Virulence protein SciE type n=1 Tax=Methylomonas albis TaxID=1854563 RepID=A0ABR9CUN0_9GAMM|nr:type VI secretion system accessory protein TagJ [Methylomonas albis]MBD9354530.1 virulence protein SciE type [Methylomonas albis]CAD6877418.1 Protein of avirulence locus ImpE [Methylomonas albis]